MTSVVTVDALSTTATLDPTPTLAFSTQYTAAISGAKDAANNIMTPISWTFTTAADNIAPSVLTFTPAAFATGVAVVTNVVATFSEPIVTVPTSLLFTLTGPGGVVVTSVVTVDWRVIGGYDLSRSLS